MIYVFLYFLVGFLFACYAAYEDGYQLGRPLLRVENTRGEWLMVFFWPLGLILGIPQMIFDYLYELGIKHHKSDKDGRD